MSFLGEACVEEAISVYGGTIWLDVAPVVAYHNRALAYENRSFVDRVVDDHNEVIELNPELSLFQPPLVIGNLIAQSRHHHRASQLPALRDT